MAANDSPEEGKKTAAGSTDKKLQTSRRNVLGALGLATIGKWKDEDIKLKDLDWPDRSGHWLTAEMEIEAASSFTLNVPAGGGIETGRVVEPAKINVRYDRKSVDLDIEVTRENSRTSMYVMGSPDEMRELAIALFQAAEEKDIRDDNGTDSEE